MTVPTLVLTGPVGVGKTVVAWEVAEILEERGVSFGCFDPDAIHFRPRPPDDPFGERARDALLARA